METYERPLYVAYGMGVDSTAMLVGLWQRGIRPDAITHADVGDEKEETVAYAPVIRAWLAKVGFPDLTIVRYKPARPRYAPGYETLGENCLNNATLPSLAFRRKACSLKWKVQPQESWDAQQPEAKAAWAAGRKVTRLIGYDASPADKKRGTYADTNCENAKYNLRYPLQEWGWTRDECIRQIQAAGLPVPPKSACIFCPATKPEELHAFKKEYLRKIVLLEARAAPNLQGNWGEEQVAAHNLKLVESNAEPGAKLKKLLQEGAGVQGLWGQATKHRSGRMTDYILEQGLMTREEVDAVITSLDSRIFATVEEFEEELGSLSWPDFCSKREVYTGARHP